MQLIAIAFVVVGILIIKFTKKDISNLYKKDISNLYNSRDNIWKEHFALQQACKRRDKEYRKRIHTLERKISGLTRGQSKTQQPDS